MAKRLSSKQYREIAAKRRTFRGGRKSTCNCGKCLKCRNRAAVRKYRAGKTG